jgi:transketolase
MEQFEKKPLGVGQKAILATIAATIRGLSMDAVQRAVSGHPGLPLGCAEIGAYLYGAFLIHNPKNPSWPGRDRFVLSAGHGSMLLYSCLHLSGFDLTLDDIRHFRQFGSKTPGHPESFMTPGVESTTGPLGQGVGHAVGMALGLKILAEKFNTDRHKLFGNKVIFLAGDGCMMEGVSSEASSFAGHLKLSNLIGIYDSNSISLDGPLSESSSENTRERYLAYGWQVFEIDGHSLEAIHDAMTQARAEKEKPVLIIAKTIIGKGSPHKAGTHQVHGSPLGVDEVRATKEALGIPQEEFYVPKEVSAYFEEKQKSDALGEQAWNSMFEAWSLENPRMREEFNQMCARGFSEELERTLTQLEVKTPTAGRRASQEVVAAISEKIPDLYGGSADLSCSDLTMMKKYPVITPGSFRGRNIKFGVREFGMASMAIGLSKTGMIRPFIGTFLVFSDYMKNSIRLAAMMRERVIYQFTHDSIFLGEDGPTHQPIEQLAALRAIPNLLVIRPGSSYEVKMAWIAALSYNGPTALILSRQNIREVTETHVPYQEGMKKGAYIIRCESAKPHFTLIATGSEVPLAMDVATALEARGRPTRVISMPCQELFEAQDASYQESVLGDDIGKRVSIEAARAFGWHKYIGRDGVAISVETFGASAPIEDLEKEYGFTVDSILGAIL